MWLVRGLWGQLCGPRQRGLAVCLLKEEKHHSGLLIQPHLGAPAPQPVFALAAWLGLRKVVGLEQDGGSSGSETLAGLG